MSKKNCDPKGRFRARTIAFRISEEENEILNRKVKLSGKTKQDYIISCVTNKDIVVQGNPYVIRSLHDELVYFIERFEFDFSSDDKEMLEFLVKMICANAEEKKTRIKAIDRSHANESNQ